ncbi:MULTISPECIES: hypothetical protein [Pseudonocardia]|uniref:Ferric siderophore reductase C-terminal domain-containing protein n=2 Tax=Pseudonocardia TaxID=1847 RepID=A0A1Y2N8W0_PSEAH|nr:MULTISPECIES: hypothetical protein [Pseudonocardia]OSY43912.1 hypothetical protein BG845_00032 [Pseudonocardia autotrophica]TDN74355.1 hypothetical protein C8E95_3473 [Pseudonocardia autotrophica]BBG05119.1 hypothetical protein Pdca_63280 [Pseudonocardia autotrophica]GEC27914.1 hypothetical protein PSA01_49430 [Pseudonocardia saturnea]
MIFPSAPGTVPVARIPLGDRFVARSGRPPGWTPAAVALGSRLDDTLARAAADRSAPGRAVAAVLLLDRYALRLAAPVLAAFHELDTLLDARPGNVALGPDEQVPGWLAFAEPGIAARADPAALCAGLLTGSLLPLADELAARTRAGRRVLRGSVAHAVALSALHLSWHRRDPDRLVTQTRDLLGRADLDRLVTVGTVDVDGAPWMTVSRRACCLAFRTTPPGGPPPFCGTCPCLDPAGVSTAVVAAVRSFRERNPAPDAQRSRSR